MLVDIDPTVQQWLFLATLSDFVTDSTLLIKIAPTTDRDWLTALLQYSSCNTGNPSHVTCSDVGWLSSLVFYVPVNTIYVIWETNFYKSKDPTDSIKVLKEKTTKEKNRKRKQQNSRLHTLAAYIYKPRVQNTFVQCPTLI